MKMNIPVRVQHILDRLTKPGHEAYVVGGCVRDSLLGATPKDWDVTTSALPTEVLELFSDHRVIETGLQHGTVTVMHEDEPFEITTYRVDGVYSDGRRPDAVEFTRNLKDDLLRRDFTINALAYNTELVNYFNGVEDIQAKVIRAVGDPNHRFTEDGLRILRGLRFAAVLGFEIDFETEVAMYSNLSKLNNVSAERIQVELTKLLKAAYAGDVLRKHFCVLAYVIPELGPMFNFEQNNPNHTLDVWNHTVEVIMQLEKKSTALVFAALFHDIGKPSTYVLGEDGVGHFYSHASVSTEMAEQIMTRLRFSTAEKEHTLRLIKYHDIVINPDKKLLLRLLNKQGEDMVNDLIVLRRADLNGKGINADVRTPELNVCLDMIEQIKQEVAQESLCFKLKDLAVSGKTLIALGHPQGENIGDMLDMLLEAVMDGVVENTEVALVKYLEQSTVGKM